jgi:hypothetical protein
MVRWFYLNPGVWVCPRLCHAQLFSADRTPRQARLTLAYLVSCSQTNVSPQGADIAKPQNFHFIYASLPLSETTYLIMSLGWNPTYKRLL